MLILHNAAEYDGKLLPEARLLHLSGMELLNFAFADIMDGADSKQRRMIMAGLEGRIGPNGRIIVDDPDLPESMQGMEAPDWWDDGLTDMNDTFTVN